MDLTTKQKFQLKKLIKELATHRGRHTELVSVYVPQDYDLNKIINHLSQEQGTATNIKSSGTRKNVIDALERMIQHLRLFKKTPKNGLVIFSGNVSKKEGQSDVQVWSIEPPVPLKTRIYRCDKKFVLEILKDMCETKEVYGLIVMDRREGNIALLKGKAIIPLVQTKSNVPGKTRAGGQCLLSNSLVQLSDGSIPTIKILHNPNKVSSIMIKKNFIIKESKITDKWNKKKNEIYKITTKYPRLEIESSKDHVFFTVCNGKIIEKSAKELTINDILMMPEKIQIKGKLQKINSKKYYNSFKINEKGRKLIKQKRLKLKLLQKQLSKKLNITQTAISLIELGKRNINRTLLQKLCNILNLNFKSFLEINTQPYLYKNIKLPKQLNEEFSQFLGYQIGDGTLETDRITFFEQNKQVALDYQKKYNKFLKINSSYKFRKDKNYYQIRFTSRPLVRLIKKEFPEIKKALNSEIPKKILQSKNQIVASFLKGLFDAEGYINTTKGIGFGINNKRLAQQTQLILLRFSIISSLHEYDNKANKYSDNHRFTIDITEKKSLELFKQNIGFTSKKKTKKLNTILKRKSDKSNVRQIIIPGNKIRNLIENVGYNLQLFPKVNHFFNNKRMISKQTFKSSILINIKNKKLYKKLKEIYDYPVLPVKINKIKLNKKITTMTDISVKNQNFIANGLIVHNSAQRFERLREGAAKDFYKKIGELVKDEFLNKKELKGILVGGPGPTKYDFVDGNYITDQVKQKILAIKDLGYTGDFGIKELVEKSKDVLAEEEIAKEKKLMDSFFKKLAKEPKMVAYGEKEVMHALNAGAVDILLISEDMEDKKIEELEKTADNLKSNVEIISTETKEGVQLTNLGKVAAILRYKLQ